MLAKKKSLQNKKDIIPTNDIDGKQSTTNNELAKKKIEVDKLNK